MSIITKSLSEKTTFEIGNGGGETSFVTWNHLQPKIAEVVGLRDNERILGLMVTEDGVYVRIEVSRKDSNKRNTKRKKA